MALRIMTPTAAERAAFEKNARSDAGAVVQRELANFENKAANRLRRGGRNGDFGDFGGGFSGKIGHSANDWGDWGDWGAIGSDWRRKGERLAAIGGEGGGRAGD